MIKIGIFLFFFLHNFLFAKDFCEIKNIEKFEFNFFNCNESQMLFGYLKFVSEKSNFSYKINDLYDVKIINNYYDEITSFIDQFCSEKKKIRIKDITNYNKLNNNFITTIVLSCTYNKK